jgi:thymidylate synthase
MRVYLDYLRDILKNGTPHADRTGTGTHRVFGRQLRFDLTAGFPLVTTKKMFWNGIVAELLWFVSGSTNIRPLVRQGVSIWTDWPLKRYREATGDLLSKEAFESRIAGDAAFAQQWGDLGPVYGKQWRAFEGPERRVDQLKRLVEGLQARPHSRRHLVSAWHPAQIEEAALPPCHYAFQCFVEASPGNGDSGSGRLSLMWQQRSVDSFLGLPFNIASYALLTHMLAQQAGLDVGDLIFSGGDCHIYDNHRDAVREQLRREPRPRPTLRLRPAPSLFSYTAEHVTIEGYDPHPALRAPIAV